MPAVGVLLIACDFPTEPPRLQSRFLIPGARSAVALAEFLPPGVQTMGNVFRIGVAGASLPTRSLASMCGAPCTAVHGQLVPKPAFSDSTAVTLRLPNEIVGATVVEGVVDVELTHNLGFDLLRPSGAVQTGTIRVTARSAARVVGELVLEEPFPSGVTLARAFTLTPGEVASDVVVSIVVTSPAGGTSAADRVPINMNAGFAGGVTPVRLDVAEARVRVQNKVVAMQQVQIDLSGIDESVMRRTRGGAALLTIDNPFGVTGVLQLRVTGNGVDLTKTVQLTANQSMVRVDYTQDELQALLGRVLTLRVSGPVTGPGGQITVRPGQEVSVTTRFELVLEIG